MNPFHPTVKASTIRDKFALARKELSAALIERDEEVECAV